MQKVINSLKFYYKEKIEVQFKLKDKNPGGVKGMIIQWGRIGILPKDAVPYIIIKEEKKPKMKVYLDEIDPKSIIPVGIELK